MWLASKISLANSPSGHSAFRPLLLTIRAIAIRHSLVLISTASVLIKPYLVMVSSGSFGVTSNQLPTAILVSPGFPPALLLPA